MEPKARSRPFSLCLSRVRIALGSHTLFPTGYSRGAEVFWGTGMLSQPWHSCGHTGRDTPGRHSACVYPSEDWYTGQEQKSNVKAAIQPRHGWKNRRRGRGLLMGHPGAPTTQGQIGRLLLFFPQPLSPSPAPCTCCVCLADRRR